MPLTQYFFLSLVLPEEGTNFPQNPSPGNFLSVLLLSKNETHTQRQAPQLIFDQQRVQISLVLEPQLWNEKRRHQFEDCWPQQLNDLHQVVVSLSKRTLKTTEALHNSCDLAQNHQLNNEAFPVCCDSRSMSSKIQLHLQVHDLVFDKRSLTDLLLHWWGI